MAAAWGKKLQCFQSKHPCVCLHSTAQAHMHYHVGRGLTDLLPTKNPCPSLSSTPGLVPEPPGQMAEAGEVLGQEQRDG